MGRYRRKVRPRKSHTSRRKGNAKGSFIRSFKRTCALIFASALVLFFIVNPPFFRSFVRKSELLYQNIELRIHERSGVFTSIAKKFFPNIVFVNEKYLEEKGVEAFIEEIT